MKLQGSHMFIAAVVAVILIVWLGYKGYAAYRLSGVVIDTIEPGRVNIVAVSPAAGYKIIVANQVAYLAKVEGDLEAGEMEVGAETTSEKSRLPLRELLATLQGDESALGVLVMRLNDWIVPDISRTTKVWKAEDIEKALGGDAELESRLVTDLNVDLKGVPLDTIRMGALLEGIVIDIPITMDVNVGGTAKSMTARVQEVYQPRFGLQMEQRMRDVVPGKDTTALIQGIYQEEALPIVEAGAGEDVRRSLKVRIDKERTEALKVLPSQVLTNTDILLNESHVTSASYKTVDVGQGQEACDISIGLTDKGRMRLWKYSHENRGFQLLFIVDSVAIAAPLITTDLAESTVTIRRVPSKDLVADAIELLNEIMLEKK
jgi:hypothetical protein